MCIKAGGGWPSHKMKLASGLLKDADALFLLNCLLQCCYFTVSSYCLFNRDRELLNKFDTGIRLIAPPPLAFVGANTCVSMFFYLKYLVLEEKEIGNTGRWSEWI